MKTRNLLPLMLALALAGCTTVGPDYQVPADSVAERQSAQFDDQCGKHSDVDRNARCRSDPIAPSARLQQGGSNVARIGSVAARQGCRRKVRSQISFLRDCPLQGP